MWDPYAEFEKRVLPNGLEIYAAHWPGRDWVKAGFIIHAGAEHDSIGAEGTAHFVEHLVSENAKVSNKIIRDFFRGYGGGVNLGVTGYFYTNYKFILPATANIVTEGMEYFADMLVDARLQNYIERERSVIQREINNKFSAQCFMDAALQQRKAIFKGFFLERFVSPFGFSHTVEDMNQDNLQGFYDKYYQPSNMSLVFVGGMSIDEIVDIILQTSFAQNVSYYRTENPLPVTSVDALGDTRLELCYSDHDIHGIDRSTYTTVAKVPNVRSRSVFKILDNMLDEILFEEIREKRTLAYSFGAGFSDVRHFTEVFVAGNIKKGCEQKVSEIVAKIIKQFDEYGTLFENSRNNLVRDLSLIDVSGGSLLNDAMAEVNRERRIISAQEAIDECLQASFDDVLHLMQFLAPEYRHEYVQIP